MRQGARQQLAGHRSPLRGAEADVGKPPFEMVDHTVASTVSLLREVADAAAGVLMNRSFDRE
ncbi:hypothetical protein ACFZDK_46075 [Streptomyces sp. NPDC007901]|uniref:hypothetical protein n=1 Tax=Streptomyces sp. NPDC007901 TaxID=3364785 RepID=UPI0036E110CE